MNEVSICLTEWQARIVLEALGELEGKWQQINRTTQVEDEQADYETAYNQSCYSGIWRVSDQI